MKKFPRTRRLLLILLASLPVNIARAASDDAKPKPGTAAAVDRTQ